MPRLHGRYSGQRPVIQYVAGESVDTCFRQIIDETDGQSLRPNARHRAIARLGIVLIARRICTDADISANPRFVVKKSGKSVRSQKFQAVTEALGQACLERVIPRVSACLELV